jgi:hypothetical protein
MDRYCRICWNTADWRYPSGEAKALEQGKTYVRANGFGHEEWLFNFAWLQSGPPGLVGKFRYGFLQPVGKFRHSYQGKTLNVFLYTVAPNGERIGVATIQDLFVPEDRELEGAHETLRQNGWLHEMEKDLARLSISPTALEGPASHLLNVRFEQSNVTFLDPRPVFPRGHVSYRLNRYHALKWDRISSITTARTSAPRATKGTRIRSEAERTRAAVRGIVYDPRHVIMQNAVYKHLCARHGKSAVHYEFEFVDVRVELGSNVTFFELKTANTAKKCLREAIGQLLEYGVYPAKQVASKLVVIGDGPADSDDKAYLMHLRREFGLPLFYQQWNWEREALEHEC